MADYGRLVVGVTADTSQMSSDIAKAANKSGQQAGQTVSKGLSANLRSGVGTAAKKIGNTLASGFTLATGAALTFGAAMVKSGAEANAAQQEQQLSFKALTGSTKVANELLDAVGKINMQSVFPKGVLTDATKSLIGFGWNAKQIPGVLNAIQNAAAATGDTTGTSLTSITNALGRVQATGKFTSRQFATLGAQGVNAAKLIGDNLGMTGDQVKKSIADGTLSGKKALQALTDQMAVTYKDAGKDVTGTWVGSVALLKKSITGVGKIIAAPFIDPHGGGYLVIWANDLQRLFVKIAPAVQRVMQQISAAIGPTLDKIGPMIDRVTKAVSGIGKGGALTGVMSQITKLGPMVAGLAAIFAKGGGNIAEALGPLGKIIPSSLFNPWVAGVAALVATNPAMRAAFGKVIASLQPLLGVVAELAKTVSTALAPVLTDLAPIVSTVGVQLAQALVPAVAALIPLVKALAPLLLVVAKVLGVVLSNKAVVDVFIALFVAIAYGSKIMTALSYAIKAVQIAFELLAAGSGIGLIIIGIVALGVALVELYKHSATFRKIVQGAFNVVKDAGALMVKALKTALGALKTALTATFQWVRDHWKLLAAILGGPFVAALILIVSNWKKIKSAVTDAFSAVKTTITNIASKVRAALVAPFTNAVSAIGTKLSAIKGKVIGAFSGAATWLVGIGRSIVSGLIAGIQASPGAIKDALLALIPGPLKHLAGKLGINSPSKLFAREIGKPIPEGIVYGINQGQGALDRRVQSLVGRPSLAALASGGISGAEGRSVRPRRGSTGATVNVYPRQAQSEQAIAAATSRELGWAARTA